MLQMEYWDMKALRNLNRIYEEIKNDSWLFVELYRLTKTAGMSPQHVKTLLEIANNDLQSVEPRYEELQNIVNSLQSCKANLESNRKYYSSLCKEEMDKMSRLSQERLKGVGKKLSTIGLIRRPRKSILVLPQYFQN